MRKTASYRETAFVEFRRWIIFAPVVSQDLTKVLTALEIPGKHLDEVVSLWNAPYVEAAVIRSRSESR